jgi:hypothetical protein
MIERSNMPEIAYEPDSHSEKSETGPVREHFDSAIKRLYAETEQLIAKLDPLLGPSLPRAEATIQEVSPYGSSFASQVQELHGLASRLSDLCGRIEF